MLGVTFRIDGSRALAPRGVLSLAIFVLVHGGWHGGWCWERVSPLLEQAGHQVLAPDLPGHGFDRTPPSERPWERYVPSIAALTAAQPGPVILVGHSSGGMIISEVARRQPGNVAALVYLAAFLLPAGATPREVMGDGSDSLLPQAMVVDPVAGVTTIRPEMARDVFYHDCSDADVAWALERLQPEPVIPTDSDGATHNDPAVEPQIPRIYIETLHDRALPLDAQRRMHATSRLRLSMPWRPVTPRSCRPHTSLPKFSAPSPGE